MLNLLVNERQNWFAIMMLSSMLDARLFDRQVEWFDRLDARVEKGEVKIWSE